ncbi:MAG TPA: 50S ribosomal protein L35 [Candidatus Sumerlaeota bacterium]|nr:50S ribosomal protein L35 [Candidatus Sumerlaeota bacterium]
MPKMKSKRSAVKRFKVTGSGQIMRRKANHAHILTKKSRKRKRHLKEDAAVPVCDMKKIRKFILE